MIFDHSLILTLYELSSKSHMIFITLVYRIIHYNYQMVKTLLLTKQYICSIMFSRYVSLLWKSKAWFLKPSEKLS